MRTMKTIMWGLALAAPALFAQDQADVVKRRTEEMTVRFKAGTPGTFEGQTFEYVGGQMIGGNPVKGAPYSAEAVTESTQTLPDGNRIVHKSSSLLYRDSEGRERREESFDKLGNWSAQGEPAKAIFISDPVAKTSYTLDTKTHTAHKGPGDAVTSISHAGGASTVHTFTGPAPRGPLPAAGGVMISSEPNVMFYSNMTVNGDKSPAKTEQLGKKIIEGVQAEGTRTTITIPAGQMGNERPIDIVSERWYSPELQMTVLSKHSDPRMGETVYKLTNVNRSEPMRSYFEVPSDYTIAEPEIIRLRTQRKESKEDQLQ